MRLPPFESLTFSVWNQSEVAVQAMDLDGRYQLTSISGLRGSPYGFRSHFGLEFH